MDWYAKITEDMNNHALRDYPREACGVILDDFIYIPCKNISMEPTLTFILDPAVFIKYDNIWGIFHSHPGSDKPIPSQDDKISAAFQQYKFLVGFNNQFYIYWMDNKVDALKFDQLRKEHFI
tara:strand:+ start:565 stop:930 length:366 start_codon:yes stop_codon:yes gene_type:complete